MKMTSDAIETMHYLRKKGFTQKEIGTLLNCHPTLVEYYTTPGRMEYVKDYARGRWYKEKISRMSPIAIVRG